MSQAEHDTTCYPTVTTLTRSEIEYLADLIYSRGISCLATYSPNEKADLIMASRVLRRLLGAFERETGKQLHSLMINGGGKPW